MKLAILWIVRDPALTSVRADYLFRVDTALLDRYILGCGPNVWAQEHHAIHTTEESAIQDADTRRDALRAAAGRAS